MNEVNWSLANDVVARAFLKIVDEFESKQKDQMLKEKWDWPRATKRKSGQFVPAGPRDIIDTGELFSSLTVELTSSTEAVFYYPVDHAMLVHQGATLHTGTVIPPRPWVDAAAQELKQELPSINFE